MTAETVEGVPPLTGDTVATATTTAPKRGQSSGWLAKVLVLIIGIAWTIPTAGVFISSFRPEVEVASSGWWTVFAHPFDFTQYTLANYQRVLTSEDMFEAFVNSLIVTIPATVIPITLAAFAAYALCLDQVPRPQLPLRCRGGTFGHPAADVAGPPAPAVRQL